MVFFIIIARGSKIIPISFPAIDIHSPSGREEIKERKKSSLRIINLAENLYFIILGKASGLKKKLISNFYELEYALIHL